MQNLYSFISILFIQIKKNVRKSVFVFFMIKLCSNRTDILSISYEHEVLCQLETKSIITQHGTNSTKTKTAESTIRNITIMITKCSTIRNANITTSRSTEMNTIAILTTTKTMSMSNKVTAGITRARHWRSRCCLSCCSPCCSSSCCCGCCCCRCCGGCCCRCCGGCCCCCCGSCCCSRCCNSCCCSRCCG